MAASAADGFILNPHGLSASACEAIFTFLQDRRPECPIYALVGSLHSPEIDADLVAVMPHAPTGIVLSDCESRADLQGLSAKLAVQEAENGLPDSVTEILALTGTAAAIFNFAELGDATPRLAALAWDRQRLLASLGTETIAQSIDTPGSTLFRTLLLFAARASGKSAIDTANATEDLAAFEQECLRARADGFAGKLACNPSQAAIIAKIFG